MNLYTKIIKFFKDPHGTKIRQLKEQYQELDELSNVAVEIGDASAYQSLQSEMKDVFFDYLTAIVVDSIYRMVPQVIIVWLISLVIPVITIPILNWQVNIFAAYFTGYITYYIGSAAIRLAKSKLGTKLKLFYLTKSETN